MKKFYLICFEDDSFKSGYFESWSEAWEYAESFGMDFNLSEYSSEEDYENSL